MLLGSFAAFATANYQTLRSFLLVAGLHTFLVAPLVHDVPAAARTPTVRMVDRVHDFTANLGSHAEPTALACLPMRQQLVLRVANRSHGRETSPVHEAHLGRSHAKRDVLSFLGDYFERCPSGARHLTAFTGQ